MYEFKFSNTNHKKITDILIDHSKKPIIENIAASETVTVKRIKPLFIKPKTIIQVPAVEPPMVIEKCADVFEGCIFRLGDVYNGSRVLMTHIGLDIGTKTVVLSYRHNDKISLISEINGYWPFERATPFIENMLNDPNKTRLRSDSSVRSRCRRICIRQKRHIIEANVRRWDKCR